MVVKGKVIKPRKQKNQQKQVIAAIRRSEQFSGPLPPPRLLAEYGQIVQNGAERIFLMAENQQIHRIKLETMVVQSDIRRSDLGLVLGFILSLVIILGGFWLIFASRDVLGMVAIITAMATLVGVFIYTKETRKKEMQAKQGRRLPVQTEKKMKIQKKPSLVAGFFNL